MKIRIIQIGKNKDNYLDAGISEYLKRLKPFVNLEFMTLKEVSPSKTFPVKKCVDEEGQQILKALNNGDYLLILDEKGKEMGSVNFAKILKSKKDIGRSICIVIGGPFGLAEEVINKADMVLSMSKMTFTHQMIRLFLLEQIYRAVCIIQGKEYHIA